MRKLVFNLVVVLVAVGGIVAVADALVVTDEERLDAFADALSGEVESDRIDTALGYLDPDREMVEVIAPDQRLLFAEGEGADLAAEVRDIVSPYMGRDVELLQRAIELDGNDARVALRLRTPEGVVDATFDLHKHGERWFVSRARLR